MLVHCSLHRRCNLHKDELQKSQGEQRRILTRKGAVTKFIKLQTVRFTTKLSNTFKALKEGINNKGTNKRSHRWTNLKLRLKRIPIVVLKNVLV